MKSIILAETTHLQGHVASEMQLLQQEEKSVPSRLPAGFRPDMQAPCPTSLPRITHHITPSCAGIKVAQAWTMEKSTASIIEVLELIQLLRHSSEP